MSLRIRKISSLVIFIFFLCCAITIIILGANAGVKSIEDMVEVKASIESITPVEYRNSISYDIKLNEYNNLFKVVADYEELFD